MVSSLLILLLACAVAAYGARTPTTLEKINEGLVIESDAFQAQALGKFYEKKCSTIFGKKRLVTVIMVADPGDFSATAEAKYLIENLQNAEEIKPTNDICPRKAFGYLLQQPVIIATSGIGPTAAALCMTELLQCANHIKEVIYMGTSGWSPALGGILDASDCSKANPTKSIVRLGDICISPFSVNWVCKKADWRQQCGGGELCSLPEQQSGPEASYLYGPCVFSSATRHELNLADELLDAARSAEFESVVPPRNDNVSSWEAQYWGEMSDGTGVDYLGAYQEKAAPSVFDYTQCLEADGQFFYSGVPWEMTARTYTAQVINAAFNTTEYSSRDVIGVSAMEAIGVAEALMKWHSMYPILPRIPYVAIRSTSNWLHQPVKKSVAKDGKVSWDYGEVVVDHFVEGYKYAIATESAALLSMMRRRCLSKAQQGLLDRSKCTFKIDYS